MHHGLNRKRYNVKFNKEKQDVWLLKAYLECCPNDNIVFFSINSFYTFYCVFSFPKLNF